MSPDSLDNNSSPASENRALRRGTLLWTRAALMTAVAVAAGYLLIAIPNVEMLSATIAFTGLMLGVAGGLFTGIAAMIVFGALNAYGLPYPPVWIAQIIGMATFGLVFGLLRSKIINAAPRRRIILSALLGMAITFFYDLITNAVFPLSMGVPLNSWWPYLLAGVPFALTHIASNTLFFALILPVAWTRLGKRFMLS